MKVRQDNTSSVLFDTLCQKSGKAPLVRSFEERAAKVSDSGRRIVFTLSTEGKKRDGNEIVTEGWRLENYRNNPVVLYCHDRCGLPIAKSVREWKANLSDIGRCLRGEAEFLEYDEKFPLPDQVFRMYQRGVLNAVSVSWNPLKYEYLKDEGGYFIGIRFNEQELVEYSAVPVPADPDALVACLRDLKPADMSKFDLNEMLKRVEGEGEDLVYVIGKPAPILERSEYFDIKPTTPEVPATHEKEEEGELLIRSAIGYDIHDKCTVVTDKEWYPSAARIVAAQYATPNGQGRRADIEIDKFDKFFLFRGEGSDPASRKLAHHSLVDGKLAVVAKAVERAAQRLQQTASNYAAEDLAIMRTHLEGHFEEMGRKAPWTTKVGQLYEELHADLAQAGTEDDSLNIRSVIETLAPKIYGEGCLNEPWMLRSFKDDLIGKCSSVVEEILTPVISDLDEKEELVDRIVSSLSTHLSVFNRTTKLVNDIFEAVGPEKATNGEELLEIIKERFAKVEEMEQNKDCEEIDTHLLGKVEDLLGRLDSEPKQVSIEEDLEGSIKLFDSILKRIPDAGTK